jgi:hypothetical protein
MKTTELKKLLKEAVREAIQEELKDILLEAVRSPKPTISAGAPVAPVVETSKPTTPTMSPQDQRAAYASILEGMTPNQGQINMTSADVNTFVPRAIDSANGSLPDGNVGLDKIMGLMNSK